MGTGVLAGAHTRGAPHIYVGGNPRELAVWVGGDLGAVIHAIGDILAGQVLEALLLGEEAGAGVLEEPRHARVAVQVVLYDVKASVGYAEALW